MAIKFIDTDIHTDVKKVTGLPSKDSDNKKRQSEIQSIRNAVLKVKGELIQRNPDVYVARTAEAAKVLRDTVTISREGRKAKYSAEDMFGA